MCTKVNFVIMGTKALIINNTASPTSSSQLLSREGYNVDMVCSTDAGLRQLSTRDYDVIIVKASPEAESWRLCEEIRQLSGRPLIVISTNASTETCVKAINAGADFFLRKPLGPLEFTARVRSLLQRTSPKSQTPITV